MPKHKRIITLAFALVFIISSISSVGAYTPMDEVEEEVSTPESRVGAFQDQFDEGGVSFTLIHTLTVNDLSGLIYNSAKTITKNSLPAQAVRIYAIGRLTKSGVPQGASHEIRTGLCYYNSDIDQMIGDYYREVDSGEAFSVNLCAKSSLNQHITYYPYIKNLNAAYGNVSGSVGFYYSTS